VWASCTFPFTLAREVAMSRVVVDGGEQHDMHCEILTLVLIPNLQHTSFHNIFKSSTSGLK
jgi:hypothetical protein